jgi:putative transposase
MSKYLNQYRIQSTRLPEYDYGSHGLYYVTICTKNQICYFGEIDCNSIDTKKLSTSIDLNEINPNEMMQFSFIGQIAYNFWAQIPEHYPFVEIKTFVIMPNHIHGILYINQPNKTDWNKNKFGSQSKNLPAIIRGFKSSVKREANLKKINFDWQPRYYEQVITSVKTYNLISDYIRMNPWRWKKR